MLSNNSLAKQIAIKLVSANRQKPLTAMASPYGHFNNLYGDHRSGGAKWRGGLSGDGRGFVHDHRRLRQNSRTAYCDNLLARSIVERFAETVADTGLKFESAPKANILGISQIQAEAWGRDVDERFDLWAQAKSSHRSEVINFYQAQRLYAIGQQRDGENFVRLYYSSDATLLNPLQFEFIDPDQLVGDALTTSHGNVHIGIKDGIVRNSAGKEIAYEIRVKKGGKIDKVRVPAKGAGSGRTMMIHGFCPEYAGQKRGYSRIGHALQEFQNLTDFSLAQIMKAINQSQFFMFTKPSGDNAASNPLEDLASFPAGPASRQFGSNPQPDSNAKNVTEEALCPVSYHDTPMANFSAPGSTGVFNLDRGEDLKPFVNTAPAESYDKFVDSFAAYLTASCGAPIEIVLMRLNRNYTAARGAFILFWRVAAIWQHEMAVDYLNPTRASWIAEEIASGRISAPGWSDPILRAAWLFGNWYGAPLPNIDPVKTSKSDRMDAEMGIKTLNKITRERTGSDGEANRAKITREFAEIPDSPWNPRSSNAS